MADYRDEHGALIAQVDALRDELELAEERLAQARGQDAEIEALRERLAQAEARLDTAGTDRPSPPASSSQSEEKPHLLKTIFLGGALLIAFQAVVALVGFFFSTTAALILAVLGGLVLLIGTTTYLGFEMLIGSVLAIAAGGIAAMTLSDYHRLLTGPTVSNIAVRDAADHPKSFIFHFKDGRVSNKTGFNVVRTRDKNSSSTETYAVAAIVGDSWQEGQPIGAWAACKYSPGYDRKCKAKWGRKLRAGYQVSDYDRDAFNKAVQNAKKGHKLNARAGAPILYWEEHPRQAAEAGVRIYRGLFFLLNGSWLAIVLMIRLFSARKDNVG
jgi:hypothetical protein